MDAKAVLRGETPWAREQWLRRQLFVQNILVQNSISLHDSTLSFRLQQQTPLSLNQAELRNLPPRVDDIEERIRSEQLQAPPMLNIGNLIGAGLKSLAGKISAGGSKPQPLAVIPSELEIEVMNVLWQTQAATATEIYAHLDSAQQLTAVDLQQALDAMAERGLLDRQQISPKNEFTILGAIPFEMSAKNRKNREYLYRPQVARQTLLSFLDATAFSYRLASPGNHSSIVAYLQKLMSQMVKTEE